jgi:CelD/BcsL family acetyltransferase involved in cellulose biosynthesis
VWALQVGETTVATLCAVVSGGGMFHLKTAYDERHASFSPGLQLELDILEAFHRDARLTWIDSCTAVGPSPSALLYPDRRVMQTLVVPLGGARSRLAAHALHQALRGRSWAATRRDRSAGARRSADAAAPAGA